MVVYAAETGKLIRELPIEIGSCDQFNGDPQHSEIFIRVQTFFTQGIFYKYDFAQLDVNPSIYRQMKPNLEGFNSDNYETKQVFFPGKDGTTKIPMYIVRKKSTAGPKRCLVIPFGEEGSTTLPFYSSSNTLFMKEFDAIIAVLNIRGGGEYGEKWHTDGCALNRQNHFDDIYAAAKYLVDNNYTTSKQMALQHGSSGGVAMNQQPNLFAAVYANSGVYDLLRFKKFTIGYLWVSELSDPDKKEGFDYISKYSPLHNVKPPTSVETQYPWTLILAYLNDEIIVPLHSLKFTATLHHACKDSQFQKNPILLRMLPDADATGGDQLIEEVATSLVFLKLAFDAQSK